MTIKTLAYSVAVGCFVVAGVYDFAQHHPKEGIVAWLFAVCNALIFLWRQP